MDVVSVDKSGRVVLPKDIREKIGITKDSKLLVMDIGEDKILLKKLDRDAIAKRLKEELRNIDIERISKEVRDEVDGEIKKEWADVFA
jgi:AbrB family looped-hinge helix DNA binding protein